jgi:hypothetical protein
VEVGDTGYLTSFSIDGEHCLDTSSEATQSHSNVLRVDSNGRVLQNPHRGFSCLVFDLPPNPLASTISYQ